MGGQDDGGKQFCFRPVAAGEICKIINGISDKKSTGVDGISPKILKNISPVYCDSLASIINRCFNNGRFPDDMKFARVTPIHKKNDKLDKSMYRLVSVLTTRSKVCEL